MSSGYGMAQAPLVVLAFGGNALAPEDAPATHGEQARRAASLAKVVRSLRAEGYRVLVTHGNGPQVGNLALQQEATQAVPPQPLFTLGAMTQGQIGHLLTLPLLRAVGDEPEVPAAAVVTHVLVDAQDPAFDAPSKPIGPFFSEVEASQLAADRGWRMVSDAGRGHRRVVPSPQPREVLEGDVIRTLLGAGVVVVAAGGGGVPVARQMDGTFTGVDAVIDKDRTAQALAASLGADALALITSVDHVALDFGTPRERVVEEMTASEALRHLDDGQFPPGSMGPKVEAAVDFVRQGGRLAVVTSAAHTLAALRGEHGTRIVADPVRRQAART